MKMKAFSILAFVTATVSAGAVIPFSNVPTTVTVTVPCDGSITTDAPIPASPTWASNPTSGPKVSYPAAGVIVGPVPNPNCDPSDLGNITPKINFTLHYGSNDPSTPDSNAQISVEMKLPSVLLEEIGSIYNVVCSDTKVVITFNDAAGYEMSVKDWPSSGDFVLFTNHMGNCDVEFERGLFLVGGLTFDSARWTVTAIAERSGFQNLAGSMQIDFGQVVAPSPVNSTGPYSNSTSLSKRNIRWDPTYSREFNEALPADTLIASIGSHVKLIANSASFTSSASFRGHLDYNFWKVKVKQLYFDVDVAFDANLQLTGSIGGEYEHNFRFAPSALKLAPVNIPGILTLGPAIGFAIGTEFIANGNVKIVTQTEVKLEKGNAHVDFLNKVNTGTSGWKPTYSALASLDANTEVQLNPSVELGVELAVNFLGGLLDLSSGIKANATLSNVLTGNVNLSAGTTSGIKFPDGMVDGKCMNGIEYNSNFYFGVTGYVTQFWEAVIYQTKVPVFDKCWSWGGLIGLPPTGGY